MTELFFRQTGPVSSAGPPVILLHGLFGSSDNLGALARGLSEHRQVIAVDLRNHGRSPHTHDHSYPAMAGDVTNLMDKLDIETADFFGHSMGGKVAMQLALNAPDRVSKLAVGDIAPVAYSRHHDRILEGMNRLMDERPNSRAAAGAILGEYEQEPAVLSFLLTNWRRTEEGGWGWRINLPVIQDQYDHLMAVIVSDKEQGHFSGPTLFFRGGLSDYIQPDHKDVILDKFPAARVLTIEKAGHWFHAEKPDLVLRRLKRFLELE